MENIKMTGTGTDRYGFGTVNTYEVNIIFKKDGWYDIERLYNGICWNISHAGPKDLKYNIIEEEKFMMENSDYNNSIKLLFSKYLKNKGITK